MLLFEAVEADVRIFFSVVLAEDSLEEGAARGQDGLVGLDEKAGDVESHIGEDVFVPRVGDAGRQVHVEVTPL